MNFQKYTQKLIMLLGLLWFIVALCTRLGVLNISLSTLYITFGGLVCLLGIQNLIALNVAAKNNTVPAKVTYYEKRFGKKYGLVYYAILSVGVYILFGALIIIGGFIAR